MQDVAYSKSRRTTEICNVMSQSVCERVPCRGGGVSCKHNRVAMEYLET